MNVNQIAKIIFDNGEKYQLFKAKDGKLYAKTPSGIYKKIGKITFTKKYLLPMLNDYLKSLKNNMEFFVMDDNSTKDTDFTIDDFTTNDISKIYKKIVFLCLFYGDSLMTKIKAKNNIITLPYGDENDNSQIKLMRIDFDENLMYQISDKHSTTKYSFGFSYKIINFTDKKLNEIMKYLKDTYEYPIDAFCELLNEIKDIEKSHIIDFNIINDKYIDDILSDDYEDCHDCENHNCSWNEIEKELNPAFNSNDVIIHS